MAGIAGITKPGKTEFVKDLLSGISHRGKGGMVIFSTQNSTMGAVYSEQESVTADRFGKEKFVSDSRRDIHFAAARETGGAVELSRDPLGAVPLYYGFTEGKTLCFASEIKSLVKKVNTIYELTPGSIFYKNNSVTVKNIELPDKFIDPDPAAVALKVRNLIETAVKKRIDDDEFGSWLSGGLDSSIIAAAAIKHLSRLYTFAAGLKDSPDIKYARVMAGHLKSKHSEVIVDLNDLIKALPDVIYHLESFDPLLVRSSITNYLVTRRAADYVYQVFSGEGGDELYAGYHYLKNLPRPDLPAELIKITNALHNTALQRVDRSSSAFGVIAHVPFLDPDVVDYTIRIPPELKIKDGTEKWILRKAFKKYLPAEIFNRSKSKFWEGAGVQNLLADYADKKIPDSEYSRMNKPASGIVLRSKEEYLYYRIFEEHFGSIADLSFLGFSNLQAA